VMMTMTSRAWIDDERARGRRESARHGANRCGTVRSNAQRPVRARARDERRDETSRSVEVFV
jgi:hypothetical protein